MEAKLCTLLMYIEYNEKNAKRWNIQFNNMDRYMCWSKQKIPDDMPIPILMSF